MSVEANGKLIYGFIHNDETAELFSAIANAKGEDNDEGEELQEKHGVSLSSIGFANVDIFSAYGVQACGKNFDETPIDSEDLAKTAEYDEKISAFLADLGIDPAQHKAGWHLLGYMD
jgi:hypothetical protein